MTMQGRRKIAEAMKKRWAKIKETKENGHVLIATKTGPYCPWCGIHIQTGGK